jgi:cytochrome b561
MAFIILALILVGLYMGTLPYGPFKLEIYALHKSFGILILWLVGLRIVWKLFSVKIEPHANHQWWERALAKLTHIFLYIAMIGMPLSGWLMSSAGEYPVPFFGLQMPDLVDKNKELAGLMRNTHEILAYMLIVAVGLHAAGALKHHFIDKDTTLIGMMANPMRKIGPYILTAIMIFFAIGVVMLFLKPEPEVVKESVTTMSETSEVIESEHVQNQWNIVKDQSVLGFKASVYKTEFTGEFKNFSGNIIFDPDNLAQSSVDIQIDIKSVDSQDEERDGSMLGEEWFNAAEYPHARFKTDKFTKSVDGKYIADGALTIKGTEMPVSLPFDLDITETADKSRQALVTGQLKLNRLDYGLGKGRWEAADPVGLDVLVDVRLTATTSQ